MRCCLTGVAAKLGLTASDYLNNMPDGASGADFIHSFGDESVFNALFRGFTAALNDARRD